MNTELKYQHRIMIMMIIAGLILMAVAFLNPVRAEAGVVVRARVGSVSVAVSSDSPRGLIVQTGPRSYRCDVEVRPSRPAHGRYVWVPGHFEKVLASRNCRQLHQGYLGKPSQIHKVRTKQDYVKRGKSSHRGGKHDHYQDVWVPGHWERV